MGSPWENTLLRLAWSHIRVIYRFSVFFGGHGITRTCTCMLRALYGAQTGPCRCLAGLWTHVRKLTITSHNCSYWASMYFEAQYRASTWPARAMNDSCKGHMGPLKPTLEFWEPVHGPYVCGPSWTHTGTSTSQVRQSTGLLRAQNHRKPVSESCVSSIFSYMLRHPYGSKIIEKSCKPSRHVVRLPNGSLVFGWYRARH